MSSKNILVTGGSGFIGSNLVDELVAQGYEVIVIDKQSPKFKNNNAKYYIMNLISPEIEKVFINEKIDIVIHLAAQTSVNASIEDPHKDSNDNIFATLNLLKYCKQYNINKIIASSSAAVYGEPVHLPIDEEHPIQPMSPYALSKHTMESYIKISGLDYILFRFANVYGPRQQYSNESGVVSIFVNNILENRQLTVFGDGEQYRDFVYVKDIVDCIIESLSFKFKNEVINISTQTKTTLNYLIETLKSLTNADSEVIYLAARKGDIKESILSNKKMKSFGLNAKTTLLEGLKSTIDFYKNYQSAKSDILVVIPARGGSVGIPRKNLRNLGGAPLISYSIKNALKSRFKPDVYVSSDDDEILYISQKVGAKIYKRDANISDGKTTLDPVIYDAYKNISKTNNKQYKLIVTLQPTTPLLKTKSLDNAIEKMLNDTSIDTLISAKDTTHLSWKKEDEKYVPMYEKRVNRQYLKPTYTETGAFLITRDSIISENNRIGKNVQLEVLDTPQELIDIDTYEDFYLTNYYLKRKNILFVVAGYNEIGFGHIYRTLLLANQITSHNITFLVTKKSQEGYEKLKQYNYKIVMQQHNDILEDIKALNPDVVINDILNTDESYMKSLKDMDLLVINFEDTGNGAKQADMIINALYNPEEATTNIYSGYNYFCARDEFILSNPKIVKDEVQNILVTFGGTDPNNLTLKTLEAIVPYCTANDIKINVVLGLGYNNHHTLEQFKNINIHKDVMNISDYMEKADLIFTSCGRTVYEIACIGTPTIVMAQNERELTHSFATEENGIINLGLGANVQKEVLTTYFTNLVKDTNKRKMMNTKMLSKDLKNGTKRVISLILSKIGEIN